MRKLSQTQLTAHVNLVKWEQQKQLQKFNLLTVHSLLLNNNPKFLELKTKIEIFNSNLDKTKNLQRKHLQYQYTKKLYQLLTYLVDIKVYERQLKFLDQVYQWSKGGKIDWTYDDASSNAPSKSRPTTATTRTRPFSAYSRPQSGYQRLIMTKVQQPLAKIQPQKKTKTNIDYDKLKPGDVEFFTGHRTIHEGEEKPKKKLKQYQRKIFYDEEQDSDLELIELKEEKPIFSYKTMSVNVQANQQHLNDEPPQQNFNEQGVQNNQLNQDNQPQLGDEQQVAEGEDQVNIDDLPLQGEGQQQEAGQVVNKLKPKFKAFIKHDTQLQKEESKFVKGVHHYIEQRNKMVRKKEEDDIMKTKMLQWAKEKSRTKREHKRRAQSARIVTKQIGIGYNKPTTNLQQENTNVINLGNIPVFETKKPRPKTAFRVFNEANRKELIQNCFITGAMSSHIQKPDPQQFSSLTAQRQMRITSLAEKPKKKTFEEILRDAEERVRQEQDEEILNVKQKFAKSKVPFETNRIAKSVTYHYGGGQDEYEEVDEEHYSGGGIIGLNMMKNPFFKVGKKKKKKKKK